MNTHLKNTIALFLFGFISLFNCTIKAKAQIQTTFGPQQIIAPLVDGPTDVITADLDNDGDMDVFVRFLFR